MSEPESAPAEPSSKPKIDIVPLIVPLLNTVAILGAIGLGVYTKLIYKRPRIREETERVKLEALHAETTTPTEGSTAFVRWGPVTVNIAPVPEQQSGNGDHPLEGKLHYLTLTFALEIRDPTQVDSIEGIRPLLMDRINQFVGKLHFNELTNAQGRYLVQSHMIDAANQILAKTLGPSAPKNLVTHVYFTQFVVQ